MAKIENKALRDLTKSEDELKQKIAGLVMNAEQAEAHFNKFIAEKIVAEKELKEVQDAIELLLTPKKKVKKNEA